MSYYQGDFYRGGFFSFLGNIAKKAVSFIPGVGPVLSTGIDVAQTALAKRGTSAIQKVGATIAPIVKRGAGVMVKHPVLTAAAAAGAVAGGASLAMHRGSRMAPGGGTGRRRRINVCNPRALRRAIRRTHGFAKLAMRTIHLIHPKKKVRFGGFRKRRRKS